LSAHEGLGRPWRLSPVQRLWLASIGLLLAACGLWLGVVRLLPAYATPQLSWWTIVPLFFAADRWPLTVNVRRGTPALGMAAAPLIIGLFYMTPLDVLAAYTTGVVLSSLVRRPLFLPQALFAIAQFVVLAGLSEIVFHAFPMSAGDFHWAAWLAAASAVGVLVVGNTITMIVAVFGTTISPYLFFWQAAQEMEDLRAVTARNGGGSLLPHAEGVARRHLRRIRWDTYVGMGFSNLIAFFIILSTAATLHAAGIGDIQTSAQAAEALRPIGGQTTFLLFSLGIIGTGMLAVPVLAGSAAYAVSESFEWQSGMDMKVHEALEFYGIIAIATAGGVALNFTHLDPMRALVWSAEINGVIAVPIMAIMMLLASREDIMGRFVIRPKLRGLGWSATVVMAVTVVAMIVTT